jgi:hypothetical protein
MQDLIQDLSQRGRLGAEWLARQVDDHGSLGGNRDLGCYYKCVYPLRIGGYPVPAARLLRQVMRLFCQDDGDLRNSDQEKASGS